MMRMTRRGLTLIEMLIVIGVVGMVLVVIVGLSIQTSRIYALTRRRVQPLNELALAMKKMDPDFREAMAIATDTGSHTQITLTMPEKDATTGFNAVERYSNTKLLVLKAGEQISYFLGTRSYPNPNNKSTWLATPDATNGNILFRVHGEVLPNTSYMNAPAIAEGLVAGGAIFDYSVDQPYFLVTVQDPNDPTKTKEMPVYSEDTPSNTKVVRIGLTIPVQLVYPEGVGHVNQTLWTQYCVRNLITVGQGP